ncbi:MAG TPA: hypothetical protein VFC47_14950 [Caulobacteraceae bacterium]|nr:hypothetical protein [Caulobacteraceae bacterium]
MTDDPTRIAMWSGPRNISTAMMRAFSSRDDCAIIDEPFYAAYLAATDLDHPMRAEVLAAQPSEWREVAATLAGPIPGGKAVFYQKHMTHHMLPGFGRGWMKGCQSAFLIRSPEEVLASYAARRDEVTLADLGFARQAEIFAAEADRIGRAPPVVEAGDVLADPRAALTGLCEAVGVGFQPAMLNWRAGPHPDDGVWGPAWYGAVRRSTRFGAPGPAVTIDDLPERLRPIAEAARPFYERLARYRLR